MKIVNNDCLQELRKMKTHSVDSIVTDPPYGVNIANLDWDKTLPSLEIWRECFRVLKTGGYIAAFSSARTYHRLAVDMESAGFETQNMLAWIHTRGYPKGISLSREFDKTDGVPVPDDEFREYLKKGINESPYKIKDLEKILGTNNMFTHYLGRSQSAYPTFKKWQVLKNLLKLDNRYDSLFEKIEKKRQEVHSQAEGEKGGVYFPSLGKNFKRHEPKSELAKKWHGWRTGKMCLRPCLDPIYLGQKPPIRPVRENVKLYGVGGLNVEGCRVKGKFPTSIMIDNSEVFGEASLNFNSFGFYPRATLQERKKFPHPTIKPLSLIKHLVRLVTPKGGVCLDPFTGSGTTAIAALTEGRDFIGMERDKGYFEMSKARLKSLTLKKGNCYFPMKNC